MTHPFSTFLLTSTLLLGLLFFTANINAEGYLSPDSIKGSEKINAETLIQLAHDFDNLVIIDSRLRSDRRQGYIAGSISLPDTETNCESLLPLIKRKNTAAVFYCNGPKCRRSDHAIIIASKCGYNRLYWFRGGFEEWQNKNYLISK